MPDNDAQRLRTVALLILAVVAAGAALEHLRGVAIPLVLATFITFVVTPAVDFLQVRARLPRLVAAVAVFTGINLVGALLTWVMVASLKGFSGRVETYKAKLLGLAERVSVEFHSRGIDFGQEELVAELKDLPLLSWAEGALGGAADMAGNIVLILIFTLFLIADRKPGHRLGGLWGALEQTVRIYIGTKFATSLVTGVACGAVMGLFGLDMALAFAVLTFLLNFVPSVGSIIAVLLPVPIALMQFSPGKAIAMLLLITVIQQVIGNGVEPKLMGKGLDLHPVTILSALIVWGMIWGLVGMLLAGPLTVMVKLLLENNEVTRPIARLLAGELPQEPPPPPLEPPSESPSESEPEASEQVEA